MDFGFEVDLNAAGEIFAARAFISKSTLRAAVSPGATVVATVQDILDSGDELAIIEGATRYVGSVVEQVGAGFKITPAIASPFSTAAEVFEIVSASYQTSDTTLVSRKFTAFNRQPEPADIAAFFSRIATQDLERLVLAGGASAVTMGAPNNVTIGTASAQLMAANANRKFASLSVVTPGAKVSLAFGSNPAVLDKGITLLSGTTYSFEGDMLTLQAINGISSIAGTVIGVQEG